MEYKILKYKPKITVDGNEYYDLLGGYFNSSQKFSGYLIIVSKDYIARPDLLSLAAYGVDDYADIICKVNGISNPFELAEDDIILIPDLEFCQECVKQDESTASELAEDIVDKLSSSNNIINNQTTVTLKKESDRRSPNEQTEGNSNYILDKSLGLVFY